MKNGTASNNLNNQRLEKAPIIQDVARQAGDAIGTVSRVINGSPEVKPATWQRVLDAMKEQS